MPLTRILLTLIIVFALCFPAWGASPAERPADMVDVSQVVDGLLFDIRYYTEHNFVGARVDGYLAPKCLLTRAAARALAGVQADLKPFGMTLRIYDCFRPQRAVSHFVRWAKDIKDTKTKKEFYPYIDKRDLFKLGYIAERSGHSRGSTVDLTIVASPARAQPAFKLGEPLCECFKPIGERYADNSLDMGGGFDCFHPVSHTANPKVGQAQRVNRLLLKSLMEKHGFENYEQEWWHYTLKNEPHPDTYFDFPVE